MAYIGGIIKSSDGVMYGKYRDGDAPIGGPGVINIATPEQTVEESIGTVTIVLERVGGTTGEVSVLWSTQGATATYNQDYVGANSIATWTDGDGGSKQIPISIINDTTEESLEYLNFYIYSPQGGVTIGTSIVRINIAANDSPIPNPGTILFANTNYSVSEGVGTLNVPVSRTVGAQGAVSIDYATSNGTAIAGSDYTTASGTLNWSDTDSADKNISISITDDVDVEASENFYVTLSNATGGATLGSPSVTTITINPSDQTSSADSWEVDGSTHTPISWAMFVPYQRIYAATQIGVQAWSKNGIDRVEFTVSGQGYTGTNPLVSTVRAYNSTSQVYEEFFVTVDPADFASSGLITIAARSYGRDGGSRLVGTFSFYLAKTGSAYVHTAWVEKAGSGGNDSTGTVDNIALPFETIPAAINALYTANSNSCDWCAVMLGEGDWVADTACNNTTTNGWLTITKSAAATEANVTFSTVNALRNSVDTNNLHIKDVCIIRTSDAYAQYTLADGVATRIWLESCYIEGAGTTWVGGTWTTAFPYHDPIRHRVNAIYSTGNEYLNCFRALSYPIASINDYVHDCCEDAIQNGACFVQTAITNLDRTTWNDGSEPLHSDMMQVNLATMPNPDNVLIYGVKGLDISYQGFFWRVTSTAGYSANNIALINNLVHLKSTAQFNQFQGVYNHLIMWHNTFINKRASLYQDTTTHLYGFTNSSLIGNYFYELEVSAGSGYLDTFEPGNSYNNECFSNHYYRSQQDGYGTTPNTGSPGTDVTVGTLELDLTDTTTWVNFGYPSSGASALIGRVTTPRVGVDCDGNSRGAACDTGAMEYVP